MKSASATSQLKNQPSSTYVTRDDLEEWGKGFGAQLRQEIVGEVVNEVGAMLNDAMNIIGKNFVRLEKKVDAIAQDVAVLKQDVAVLKQDVAVLKQDVATLKQDVAVLKQDVAVLKVDMKCVKDVAIPDLRIRMERVEHKLDNQDSSLHDHDVRITRLEHQPI